MTKKFTYAGIGARVLPEGMAEILTSVATNLEALDWHLYTGGAEGADKAFMDGVTDLTKLTVYIPWNRFNGYTSSDEPVISIKHVEPSLLAKSMAIAEQYHPNWPAVMHGSQLLMARNSFQVFGPDLETPVDCVICWTKDGQTIGGTGQALRIAMDHDIPIINLGRHSLEEAEGIIGDIIS